MKTRLTYACLFLLHGLYMRKVHFKTSNKQSRMADMGRYPACWLGRVGHAVTLKMQACYEVPQRTIDFCGFFTNLVYMVTYLRITWIALNILTQRNEYQLFKHDFAPLDKLFLLCKKRFIVCMQFLELKPRIQRLAPSVELFRGRQFIYCMVNKGGAGLAQAV
jgi:hypothetical protein